MGLQDVELVMDLEDEFGIVISDAVASEMRTVGELYDSVLPMVRLSGKAVLRGRPDLDAFVWKRLCEMSAKLSSGVKAAEISRDTRFIEDLGYG